MNDHVEVVAIVEGKTEQIFVNSLLRPYLAEKMIFMTATQVSKPGQKGGDVKFERVIKDLGLHLKQRPDTYVTTLVDFYGVKEWPGADMVPPKAAPSRIARIVNRKTKEVVVEQFSDQRADLRFIPFMAIHEFEALLFSDCSSLAKELGISQKEVEAVIEECGEPEAINNSPATAPSKRLHGLSNGKFLKTTTGIDIARKIGIDEMRAKCPTFNAWLAQLEGLVGGNA